MTSGISKWGLLIWIAMLASCGGGGGGGGGSTGTTPSASALSGVAAVGAPIVNGNINVVCATGGALAPTTTSATGSWQVNLSGQTLPCAVQVNGGTVLGVPNLTSYHSIGTSAGNVNVTPITDLTVATLFRTSTPDTWFTGLSSNPSPLGAITPAQVNNAISNLSAAFSVLPFFTATNNPITTVFSPVPGDTFDDMLSALKTAMTNSSVTYTTLLGDASTTGFPTPAGFVSALQTAYLGTSSGTNTTYYPVSAPITNFNTTSISLTLTGTYKGNTLSYSVSNVQGATNQTFLGQAANVATSTGSITLNGALLSSISETSYFSVGPYKSLGNVSSGLYTVYANQAALPAVAAVGTIGNMDTGTDYTDSTRSAILDTFVETWSVMTGPTSGTAYLCLKTVYTAVASNATSGTSTTCLDIDSVGNLLGVQLTLPLNGTAVTMSSTSLVSVPSAPTISSVTPGADSATVDFAAPANTGGSPITGYTVTAIPSSSTLLGNITVTGTTSPVLISNLTAGTAYTFTVAATNSMGTGIASAASASITPTVGAGFYVVTTMGGSGTATTLARPEGVALDSANNLYVADTLNNVIRKITPAGVVTTFAGSGNSGNVNGSGTSASFYEPGAVALDTSGNVYVADSGNGLIRKITPTGVVSTLAGSSIPGSTNGTGTAASFYGPTGIAVDRSGNVYVADSGNTQIRKITPAGVVSTLAGSGISGNINGTGTAASFRTLGEIAVDGSGNVYVADFGNSEIRMVTPQGVVSTLAGSGSCGYADGTGTAASFCQPYGIAVDNNGNVYVTDDNAIRKITPAGVVSTLSPITGITNGIVSVSNASFGILRGLAVDISGNVYVADTINDEIWKFTLVP